MPTRRVASFCLVLALGCSSAFGAGIFDSVRSGDLQKVKELLQSDPKLANALNDDLATPLHLAALEGHLVIAELLIENQASVNARGPRGETPLHLAMYGGHRELALMLLDHRADPNVQNSDGETPLHLAARKGHRELVELLLDLNADVKLTDNLGFTPLHSAAAAGHAEVVKVLLARNADPTARDKSGKTPVLIAEEKGHAEIREVFETQMTFVRSPAAAPSVSVGELSDPQRITFEGVKTFSAKAVRAGLVATPDFAEVSHPLAPLHAYLEAIERKIRFGYEYNGFPEAKVAVRHDDKAGRIVVKVEEGPRFACGEVRVVGSGQMPIEPIVKRLAVTNTVSKNLRESLESMGARKMPGETAEAFEFVDRAPASKAETPAPELDCFWVRGDPAHFSEGGIRRMTADVTETMREHGFYFPKLKLTVLPNKETKKAELRVEILETGPRAIIGQIEVVGNKKNSREAIIRYLELKPGMLVTTEVISSIQDRLWHAARFLTNSVSLGSPDADGRLTIRIEVVEHNPAPALEEQFSPAQQTMLKAREWLKKLGASGEDLVVSLSGFPRLSSDVEFIFSLANGCGFFEKPNLAKTNSAGRAAILTADHLAVYSPAQKRKLVVEPFDEQIKTFVALDSKVPVTNEAPFWLTFGASLNPPHETPKSPRYCCEVTLAPVAFVELPSRTNWTCGFEGAVFICSNSSTRLKLDAATGRLLEFIAQSEDGHAAIRASFQRNALSQAVKRTQTTSSSLINAYNTNAPLGSIAAFLLPELLSSELLRSAAAKQKVSLESLAQTVDVLQRLDIVEILSPWCALWDNDNATSDGAEAFLIPERIESGIAAPTGIAGAADWFATESERIFPAHSWLSSIAREAGLALQRKSDYFGPTLAAIYESKEPGPLAYWTLSALLTSVDYSPLAHKFAARGLERLSAADFRRDCRLLLQGDSILSQTCIKFLAATRKLTPEEVEAIASPQTPARAEFIRECYRRLRESPDKPVFEAIAPALDRYWEQELRQQITLALKASSFDAESTFKEAMRLYEGRDLGNDVQAAKLFQQLARQEHAGAQYFLGHAYENGRGVPQDRKQALNWYGHAATNCNPRAALTLGQFYSDGIETPPDHLQAFVWYSVAAAGGEKLAEVFRNAEQRKLTPDQLAQAQEQIRSFLAHRPPAPYPWDAAPNQPR